MKRTRNNSNSNSNQNAVDPKIAALLGALGISIPTTQPAQASEQASEQLSEAQAKSTKAPRTYELSSLAFTKSSLYAAPKDDTSALYMSKARALCVDVLLYINAPILVEVRTIAEKADKNGGESLCNDILALAEKWAIPAPSMRVIMQLCAPVVTVCCADTDTIARRVYGMSRANALMGSACNGLIYSKAENKSEALPFKRSCYNHSTLGLNFGECEKIEDCDFCENDEDFEELCCLCELWLKKCTPKAEAKAAQSEAKSEAKAAQSEAQPAVDTTQILKLLQQLIK